MPCYIVDAQHSVAQWVIVDAQQVFSLRQDEHDVLFLFVVLMRTQLRQTTWLRALGCSPFHSMMYVVARHAVTRRSNASYANASHRCERIALLRRIREIHKLRLRYIHCWLVLRLAGRQGTRLHHRWLLIYLLFCWSYRVPVASYGVVPLLRVDSRLR